LFIDLLNFNYVYLSLLEGFMAVWLNTQFRDASRNEWVIFFWIFGGTYCLYHTSQVTTQKKDLLEYFHILFHTLQKYFITLFTLFLTEILYLLLWTETLRAQYTSLCNVIKWFDLELKLLNCNILHECTLISFSYTFLMK